MLQKWFIHATKCLKKIRTTNNNNQIVNVSIIKRLTVAEPFVIIVNVYGNLVNFRGSPKKEELTMGSSTMIFNKDEFQAHTAGRYEKVLRKLHSATVSLLIIETFTGYSCTTVFKQV
jgi:hypothetical protein